MIPWPWKKRPVIYKWDNEHSLQAPLLALAGQPIEFDYILPANTYGRILALQYNFASGVTAGTRQMTIQLMRGNDATRSTFVHNGATASRTWHYIWDQVSALSTTLFGLEVYVHAPLANNLLFMPGDILHFRLAGWFVDDVAISFQLTYIPFELY